MTTLNLDENRSLYQIRSYQPGLIRVNEKSLTESLIITPSTLIEHWAPQSAQDLSSNNMEALIALKPGIVLIGTGAEHIFLSPDIYGALINLGIGVEVMSTQAAARTFNALSSENRNVAAALIIK